MIEQIAYVYSKALSENKDINTLQKYVSALQKFAVLFSDEKFRDIVEYPFVSTAKKLELMTGGADVENKELKNLFMLLAHKNRLYLVPEIAKILQKTICERKNEFRGAVISKEPLDDMVIDELQKAFSKKVGSNILLSKQEGSYDGVKIVVEDLGLEIAFSKERLKEKLVNHILKAI